MSKKCHSYQFIRFVRFAIVNMPNQGVLSHARGQFDRYQQYGYLDYQRVGKRAFQSTPKIDSEFHAIRISLNLFFNLVLK